MKGLYLCLEFAPHIAPAIRGLVRERAMEVLPSLRSLFLEELHPSGTVEEAIEQFVAARQLSGHPIVISHWNKNGDGQGKII